MDELKGVRVAILVDNGFEQVEMTEPKKALDQAGAKTRLVSPQADQVRSWKSREWGDSYPVEEPLDQAQPDQFDALLLPGGVMNPDHLRANPKAVAFVNSFFDSGKPVAAICHGPWTIIEAGAARGRKITSWPSLKTDCATRARNGSIPKSSSTRISFRAASPTTFRRLIAKCSGFSRKKRTRLRPPASPDPAGEKEWRARS